MGLVKGKKYGEVVASLFDPDRDVDLGPGTSEQRLFGRLADVKPDNLFPGQRIVDHDMAQCCLSGLWLWNDFLDESHRISQEIETISGSYWHGIMHRREPDYSNSKYWFRRVGDHPIFASLAGFSRQTSSERSAVGPTAFLASQSEWDPHAFIDLCEIVACGSCEHMALSKQIANVEWQLLFDYCYEAALGR